MPQLEIPELSLVVLVGVSGSGKSTLAHRVFAPTQVLSSDFFRGLVADDESDQSATSDAFDALHYVAAKRLAAGRITVVDATNTQPFARRELVKLAREHDVLPTAIVLDVPLDVCLERHAERDDRPFGAQVLRRQHRELRRSLKSMRREGFRAVHVLESAEDVEAATVALTRMWPDHTDRTGPFDVIGDVHGCRSELESLLGSLGYEIQHDESGHSTGARHPEGRTAVFVGDLVDRGPDSPGVLRLVMGMAAGGDALVVPGNHEAKLVRALDGRKVQLSHGLAETMAQLDAEPAEFRESVRTFCDGLVSHLILDRGNLVVAHAGLKEAYHGRASGRVRSFALYGDTTGETDEYGLPVRYPWARDYRGRAMVLYGHTPTTEPEWVNNTMCLDTGCVFGGRLTALRYPEREIVSVPAEQVWYEPARPFPANEGARDREPGVLDVEDVTGRRVISTKHHGRISIGEENAAGALEVMSRFGMDPRWLIYLPPTMAPPATSSDPALLEHPAEAFAAYRADGVAEVVCEEKHMGSRAVAVVCRDEGVARRRFGSDGATGAIYTRTGRPFFTTDLAEQLIGRLRGALAEAGLWAELDADWLALDTELLPWSVKAGALLRHQYASVGAAGEASLAAADGVLTPALERGVDVASLRDRTRRRAANVTAYREAYRRYSRPADGLDGVSIAPFQILAAGSDRGGTAFHDRDHQWHLERAERLNTADPNLVTTTRHLFVDTTDPASCEAGARWWDELTAGDGEGIVVKPAAGLVRSRRGLVQPGIKVRGREYLRIIYGPDYTEPEHLARLRERGLRRKRALALREYALGLEALDRVAGGEPLWRIHECVFAVLALESEPVDPRL